MHSLHRFVRRVGTQTFKRSTFRLPRCTRICKAPTFSERESGNLNRRRLWSSKAIKAFIVFVRLHGGSFTNSLQPRSCSAQISPLANVHGCVFNQARKFQRMPTSFVYGLIVLKNHKSNFEFLVHSHLGKDTECASVVAFAWPLAAFPWPIELRKT